MALESAIFSQKSPHIFPDTPSNLIICKFEHLKQLFSLQNLKTTYYEAFQPISTVFNFLIKLVSIGLKIPFYNKVSTVKRYIIVDGSYFVWLFIRKRTRFSSRLSHFMILGYKETL